MAMKKATNICNIGMLKKKIHRYMQYSNGNKKSHRYMQNSNRNAKSHRYMQYSNGNEKKLQIYAI